mgnify:CR=1 FL=1
MNNTFPTEGNLSGLNREDFQKDINDKKTDLFILKNKKGMEVAVTNYGCAILSIMVPDKNGKYANVILGHDSIDHVINSPEPFLSTTIGRYGNRIAKGKFTLYGEEHSLTINNGPNSLHGGPTGFHARVWDADQVDESTIIFNYVSADGEEGFPGNLEVEMTYRLEEEENALVIEYRATTDKATVVNLTNHGFFNLAGIANPTPTIENNIVTINAVALGECRSIIQIAPEKFVIYHSILSYTSHIVLQHAFECRRFCFIPIIRVKPRPVQITDQCHSHVCRPHTTLTSYNSDTI